MAKRSKIAQEAFDIAEPEARKLGFDLVDAEYKKEGQQMFLRLFIDKKGGISIDDCETFSKLIDPILDERLHHDADVFEVSSPGLTRALKKDKEFSRCIGRPVDIKLYKQVDGSKEYTGNLSAFTEDTLSIDCEGTTLTFERQNISSVRLAFV